jgi:hypothetical protein
LVGIPTSVALEPIIYDRLNDTSVTAYTSDRIYPNNPANRVDPSGLKDEDTFTITLSDSLTADENKAIYDSVAVTLGKLIKARDALRVC